MDSITLHDHSCVYILIDHVSRDSYFMVRGDAMRLEHVLLHVLAHAANCSTSNSEVLVKISLSGTLPPLLGAQPQPQARSGQSSANSLERLATGATPGTNSVGGGLVGAVHALPRLAPANLIHVYTGNDEYLINTHYLIPSQYSLSHTLSTHPLNTPFQHTLSTNSLTHPLNTPSHHTLSHAFVSQTVHLPFTYRYHIYGRTTLVTRPVEHFVFPL